MTRTARSCRHLGAVGLLSAALTLAPGPPAGAGAPLEFYALLDGSLGRPPNGSAARGVGHFTLNAEQTALSYDIAFDPWVDDEVFAHIHVDSIGGGGSEAILHDLPEGPHKVGVMDIESEQMRDALVGGHFFVVVHTVSVRLGELLGWIVPGTPAAPATWGRVKANYR